MCSHAAIRPTRAEIDIGALRHNAALIRQHTNTAVMVVVKADGYGHGAEAVARALAKQPEVNGFAVSLVEEGAALRQAGITQPILVMGPALDSGYDEIVRWNLTPIVSEPRDLEGLDRAASARKGQLAVHIKVDTGMGRLGILPAQLRTVFDRVSGYRHITVAGLSTHFASADSDEPGDLSCMTYAQLECFDRAVAMAKTAGMRRLVLHTANTAAALKFPAARLDLVRCGIGIYGNGPGPASGALRQAMRLVSQVAQIREVPAGTSVSYGALWRAPTRSHLAVVPIGYADGVPRRVTGKAEVLIAGHRCPVVGAVSMDISVVDVTALGNRVSVGDEVVILGRQGHDEITVREFAVWADLLEYEVTCGLSKRVPRVYSDSEASIM